VSRVKILGSALEAVAGIPDGATVLVGGFGSAGQPVQPIEALVEGGARGLTVVSNNAGNGDHGLAALIREGRVRKIVCSFPRQSDSWHFDQAWRAGRRDRARTGAAGQPDRTDPRCWRGDRRVLHPDRFRHSAG
jgi:3-oxoacid CoA-transferase A subunit